MSMNVCVMVFWGLLWSLLFCLLPIIPVTKHIYMLYMYVGLGVFHRTVGAGFLI